MSNFKAKQIEKVEKSGGRPSEWRITYWGNDGDYASFTIIVGYKIAAKETAKEVKRSLIQWGVVPASCKTTIEKSF